MFYLPAGVDVVALVLPSIEIFASPPTAAVVADTAAAADIFVKFIEFK